MKDITTSVSTETVLTLTADFRRRKVLRHLMEIGEEAIPFDELVAGMKDDVSPPTRATGDAEERLRIDLRHMHLPKLAAAGLIDYDERNGTLQYHSREDIEALVRFVEETFWGSQ